MVSGGVRTNLHPIGFKIALSNAYRDCSCVSESDLKAITRELRNCAKKSFKYIFCNNLSLLISA